MKDILERIESAKQSIEAKEDQTLEDYCMFQILTDAYKEIETLRKTPPVIMNVKSTGNGMAIGRCDGLVINH